MAETLGGLRTCVFVLGGVTTLTMFREGVEYKMGSLGYVRGCFVV